MPRVPLADRGRAGPAPTADPTAWDLVAGTPGARPRRPRRRGRGLRLAAALPPAAGIVALLTLFAQGQAVREEGGAAPVAWTPLAPGAARLGLALPDGPPLAASLRVTRGVREEAFAFGRLADGAAPVLRLVAATPAGERDALPSPDEGAEGALAQRARDDGLAFGRVAGRDALPTRFGILDLLDVDLADPGAAAGRPCTALRLRREPAAALGVEGYVCGPDGSRPEARSLACLVERLDLAGAAPGAARGAFAAAGPPHPACDRGEAATARPSSGARAHLRRPASPD